MGMYPNVVLVLGYEIDEEIIRKMYDTEEGEARLDNLVDDGFIQHLDPEGKSIYIFGKLIRDLEDGDTCQIHHRKLGLSITDVLDITDRFIKEFPSIAEETVRRGPPNFFVSYYWA